MPRSRVLLAGALALVVAAVGAYVAYDQVLSGDSVAPLALPSAPPSVGATDPSAGPVATADPSGSSAAPATTSHDGVAGTWTVAANSLAGYRVRERLATLSAESDAVGRTSDVTGSVTIESDGTTTLTGGTLTVDTTTITSDEDRRDNRLRSEGLQTDRFPTASFTITSPVEIPAAAVAGTASDVTLTGDLTLHGVTKSVSIPAQAQLVNETVQVAGSITFPLAEFDIVAPNIGGFIISIADEGTLEFQLTFAKG